MIDRCSFASFVFCYYYLPCSQSWSSWSWWLNSPIIFGGSLAIIRLWKKSKIFVGGLKLELRSRFFECLKSSSSSHPSLSLFEHRSQSTTTMTDSSSSQPPSKATTTESRPILRVAVGSTNPAKIRAVEQAIRTCISNNTNDTNDSNNITIHVVGFSVRSGVDDQPVGDTDTRQGAQNRAVAAYHAYTQQHQQQSPHFAVGMEGGVEWIDTKNSTTMTNNNHNNDEKDSSTDATTQEKGSLFCMAWMAIYGTRDAITDQLFAHPTNNTDDDPTPSQSSSSSSLSQQPPPSTNNNSNPFMSVAKTANFPLPPEITRLMMNEGLELGDADDRVFGRSNSGSESGTVGVLTNGLMDRSRYYEHALILALIPWMRPREF